MFHFYEILDSCSLFDKKAEGDWRIVPSADIELLRTHGDIFFGATDGFMMPSGLNVYQVKDVFERNKTFGVDVYCESYLLVGDNSGGRGFLVSLASEDPRVYSSDLGDLGPEDFDVEAESSAEWLSSID